MKRMLWILMALFVAVLYCQRTEGKAANVKLNEKNFPEEYFRYYIGVLYDENEDGQLSDAERAKVTEIDVGRYSDYRATYEYPTVQTLKGIEYFPNLEILSCYSNALRKLDVSKNRKLKELYCSRNALTKLDLTNNTQLKELRCFRNDLTKLDLSHNKKLETLYCSWNKISKISFKNNKNLKLVSIASNKLKELNVCKLKKLEMLYCSENQLEKLNLSKNKKLCELDCFGNKLSKLDLSNNKNLSYLCCKDNKLTKLDLRNNRLLQYLICSNNQLGTGNINLTQSQFEKILISPQKKTIRAKKIGKYYYIPLKGVNRTNEITNLSAGVMTEKGIRLKGKKLPKKITYEYNMFTDGEEKTKVEIKVKK